jgi:hypothetical protein
MGKKNGKGKLKLNDGTVINGNFQNDELIGETEIIYPDGRIYRGNL